MDTRQHLKEKNLIYGSMVLSGAVQRWSGDPQLTDVVVLSHGTFVFTNPGSKGL